MPASLRTHGPRARPYDRRSPTASPARSHQSTASAPASPVPATQDQDNEDDEPDVPQDHPGLPTYAEYKRIEAGYLDSLSPRKRDKALITQVMFDKIWDVLHQPEACSVATPQFRFWVRKMFTLSRPVQDKGEGGLAPQCDTDTEADLELERSMGIGRHDANADETDYSAVVLHENRPVAIMEQLYELFCYCHVRSGHGGRDKTCAVIREHYSWVPKELTAQFVKACPTCISKRSGYAQGGVDTGGLAHKRRVRRGKRGSGVGVGAEPVKAKPCPGLPTTGGPLDPPNLEPCSVHERERECGQDLLCTRGNKGAVGPSNSVSPARSRTQSTPPLESRLVNGWSSVPRALTLSVSPLRTCNTSQLGNPFALNNNSDRPSDRDRKQDEKENCNPRTRTSLPSLATALSDDSLDDKVDLTELGHGLTFSATKDGGGDSECVLPPALRPLRLMGPVLSGSSSDLQAFSASATGSPGTSAMSLPLQIDPVLLSFGYPGMALSSAESDAQGSGMDGSGVHFDLGAAYAPCLVRAPPGALYQPVSVLEDFGEGLESTRVQCDRWQDHDVHFGERSMSYVHGIAGPGCLPMESLSTDLGYMPDVRRRYGSRYGYRDGPFNAMLYPLHCSADEVGQQLEVLERPLSFSITS